ncbi:MAG TPA: glycosyl hydrolase, partial [Verrucomicrobiae bacterium]
MFSSLLSLSRRSPGFRPGLLALIWLLTATALRAGELAADFVHPPAIARPWVYWFWNNGNVTKAGITADLEAMQRAGIGGVIIMDVVERFAPPPGTADFMNAEWQELFQFAVAEAQRLGLEINLTNGPGWCGSSGPWITPAMSMQRLVSTGTAVTGPSHWHQVLPRVTPPAQAPHDDFNSVVPYADYYEDVAVLAYPTASGKVVAASAVTNLTSHLAADGTLDWDVPAGSWMIQRIGHVSTGSSTRPPVKGGNGLECDKLSAAAMDLHFEAMLGKLIAQAGPLAGQAWSATHIDSWEVGAQDWTATLPAEFRRRRGYDPLPYLPLIVSPEGTSDHNRYPIEAPELARRFRWDYHQTLAELLAENYVGRLATRAHEHGLRLSIEGYNLPFGDEASYTEQADEPMTEFWATGGNENETKCREMASVAHVMGHAIVGAEAFTSGDNEQWKYHPATVKALGDYEFCQGVNRFVVHRYAHQPYLDRWPGATMGPWGLHYERTQTWWEMSTGWHTYLTRCQYLLRQGRFMADLLYLRPQVPDLGYYDPSPGVPAGYKYDDISAGALQQRVRVQDGRLTLPDGLQYRVLVLPANDHLMTPELVRHLETLVRAGAILYGPPPTASPSLRDYPQGDAEVVRLAHALWGDCDGRNVTEHAYGQGKVYWGVPL